MTGRETIARPGSRDEAPARLASAPARALKAVSTELAASPDAQFEIIGHLESGDSEKATDRSNVRAEMVSQHLIDNGISAKILHITSAGSQQPLDSFLPADKRQRRVEILIRPTADMAKAPAPESPAQ